MMVVTALNLTDPDEASVSRIVEIGGVEMEGVSPTGRLLHVYCNPQRSVESTHLDLSGINDEFLARHRSFSEISPEITRFIGDSKIVVHNAPFVLQCLNEERERCGLPPLPGNRIVDTLSMAREAFPYIGNSIDELRAVLGIPCDGKNGKSALGKAEVLSEIFQELTRRTDKNTRLVEQVALVLRNSNISNLSASGAAELIDSAIERFLNGSRLNSFPDEIFVFREISAIFRRMAENTKDHHISDRGNVEYLKREIIDLRTTIDRLVNSVSRCDKSTAFDAFLGSFCEVLGKSSALVVLGAAGYFLSTYSPKSLNAFTEILLKVYREVGS